jgi:hypothetical protein
MGPAALVLTLLAVATNADAQEDCQPRDGLSTCVSSDNLWTQPGGGRFFSQAATAALEPSSVTFGFTPTYLHRPIGLKVSSANPDGTTIRAVENVLASTFLLGVGITEELSAQVAAPMVLHQRGASKSDVVGSDEALPRAAMGDVRFGVRYVAIDRERGDGLGLAARFEIAAPSGQSDAFTGFRSATYAPGVTVDYRMADFSFGFDVNARLRRATTLATANIGHQIAPSLGVSYDVLADDWLALNLETWALIGLLEQRSLVDSADGGPPEQGDGPLHVPMEWMLSARTAGLLDGRFRASLGVGSFIPTADRSAVTTPAFRVALGVHYVFAFVDEDD